MMDELYMMGDDPSVYLSPPDALAAPLISTEKVLMEQIGGDDDVIITNSTNQMLDVVNNNSNSNKRQRKGNRRQNNNQQQQRNRNRNSNNQNDGTSFDDNNPINVISAFNRTGKIYNKLRKNDAVKVIDTPSGRAGFVYQSGTTSSNSGSSSSNANNQDSPMSTSIKENNNNNNWEDPYSQNHFVNRNANDVKLIPSDDTSNKKILPVLTSDGKIALVVRGDTSRYFDESQNNGSGNSINSKKYEPITNLTSIITALNSNNDNNNFNKHNDSINVSDANVELKSIQEQNRLINRLDEFFASVTNKVKHIEEELEEKLGIDLEDDSNDGRDKAAEDIDDESLQVDQMTTTTTTMEPFVDEEDRDRKDLLLINRPLSEVLGLPKKTHYHHPHDPMHTTPTEVPYIRQSNENRKTHKTSSTHRSESSTTVITSTTTTTTEEFDLESPEKINIAVIPRFDSELEERLFGKSHDNANRNVNERTNEIPDTSGAISSIHCAMQVMIAIACACTIVGVLGAYYRNNIVNQIRIIHW
jgi:hypothetical protein